MRGVMGGGEERDGHCMVIGVCIGLEFFFFFYVKELFLPCEATIVRWQLVCPRPLYMKFEEKKKHLSVL